MTLLVASMALFGAGLTSTLSPCILPLVPGYVAVLGEGSAGGRRAVAGVVSFAVAAATVFAVLGVALGVLGEEVGSVERWLQRAAGVLLVGFACLALAGRFGWIAGARQWRWPIDRLPVSRTWRAVALGLGCGVAWTPCTGPLLGAALTAAAGSASTARSTVLLLCYACGVLAPFVAVAAFGTSRLPTEVKRWGRVLGTASTMAMGAIGLLLVVDGYDDLVARMGFVL
ncbi:MAG: cytochrome c biogenesis CcdA family protein [Ilumatobacteraceae bacterium]